MEVFQAVYKGNLITRCENNQGTSIETSPIKDALFSPTDLFAISLGTCVLAMMGLKAKALKIDIAGTTVRIEKEMSYQPILRMGRIKVVVSAPMAFDDSIRHELEAEGINCPIHKSIHPDIPVEITFTWGKGNAV